jgi:hypothetical protein
MGSQNQHCSFIGTKRSLKRTKSKTSFHLHSEKNE